MADHSPPLPTRTLAHAKLMRRAPTEAERRLWYALRAKRLQGGKWRRQHPMPPYVLDFYCYAARLVVEVDGGQHGEARDMRRGRWLEARGLKVLRFWNDEVMRDTASVLEVILDATRVRTLSPGPSPGGRGE
jgi:very-short-patch-repair endonuclease